MNDFYCLLMHIKIAIIQRPVFSVCNQLPTRSSPQKRGFNLVRHFNHRRSSLCLFRHQNNLSFGPCIASISSKMTLSLAHPHQRHNILPFLALLTATAKIKGTTTTGSVKIMARSQSTPLSQLRSGTLHKHPPAPNKVVVS